MTKQDIETVQDYLATLYQEFESDNGRYGTYSKPNTTYRVHNDLDEALLTLKPAEYRMWHRTLSLLKRNADPVLACSFNPRHTCYADLMSRPSFYTALAVLTERKFFVKINRGLYVVNPRVANKFYIVKL